MNLHRISCRFHLLMAGILLLLSAHQLAGAPAHYLYRPIAPRAQGTDWKANIGASEALSAALQAYEVNPGMTTAIGVIHHFREFHDNEALRTAIIQADPSLCFSIEVAKYEIVAHVRQRIGATKSRRLGSTGGREVEIVNWVRQGAPVDAPLPLDPQKWGFADDDIMLLVDTSTVMKNPSANESVNGEHAAKAYRDVTREVFGNELGSEVTDTQFLSPTKAWPVLQQKYGLTPDWPNYLYSWTASNPEKYNWAWGVEMLERWGWNKGCETSDVNDPVGSTGLLRDKYLQPSDPPPPNAKFAYIANNYRQIYDVHHGHFVKQCKYLVRMLDAWEVTLGAEANRGLPAGWQEARNKAFAVYTNGPDDPSAKAFESEVVDIINQVVTKTHEYHLDRVASSLTAAMRGAGLRPEQYVSFQQLAANDPKLADELDGLIVAYTNIPPELHSRLMDQFAQRIQTGEASEDVAAIFKTEIFKHVMEVVQAETDYQRGQIDAFRGIRTEVESNLGDYLKATDLDVFLEEIGKGQFTGEDLRFVDGRIRRVRRQMSPGEVHRDIRFIQAAASVLGWTEVEAATKLKEYFDQGPPTALDIVRRMIDIFDTSRKQPIQVKYTDADGNEHIKSVAPSGESLGVHCFKAALKGADLFDKGKSGKTLFENLYKIYGRGGMTDEQIGQLQAQAFMAGFDVYDLVKSDIMGGEFKLPMSGVLSQIALGTPGGALTGDEAAIRQLTNAAVKDLILLWQPELAPVFVLYDIGSWAYTEYSLWASKSDIIDAMVENGVWGIVEGQPGKNEKVTSLTPEKLKELKLGDESRLRLQNIKRSAAGPTVPKKMIAREEFTVTLIESKRTVKTRPGLKDFAYLKGYVERDQIIQASVKAISSLIRPKSWFLSPKITGGPKDWNWDKLTNAGILVTRREDQVSPISPKNVSFAPEITGGSVRGVDMKGSDVWEDASKNQYRLIGYLVLDFWVKQQKLLEDHVLRDMEKEAARKLIEKLEEEDDDLNFEEKIKEIDKAVKEIDKKLWPRFADSSDPFPGRSYNKDKDFPVYDAFKISTAPQREALREYQTFLEDPSKTEFVLQTMLKSGAVVTSPIDRDRVKERAKADLKTMRDTYYEYYDGYEKVHVGLDAGTKLVFEGLVKLEPFHLLLKPGSFIVSSLAQGVTAAASDQERVESWRAGYVDQRKRIAADVAERTKNSPAVEHEFDWIKEMLDQTETAGSPAHPLWPLLTRLRYQIQKLSYMRGYVSELSMLELKEHVGRMTIKAGEAVEIPDTIAAGERDKFLGDTIQKMEEEYQRLLQQLAQMFEIDLTMDPENRKPYIGQEVTVKAALKTRKKDDPAEKQTANKTTQAPQTAGQQDQKQKGQQGPLKLGKHGFPYYVHRFHWTIRDEKQSVVGKPLVTDMPEWKGHFPRTGLHFIEVHALDKGGNMIAWKNISALPKPLSLTARVEREEGDYNGETIEVFAAGTKRGETKEFGELTFEIGEYEELSWKVKKNAYAEVVISEKTYTSTKSNVTASPDIGLLRVDDDLKFKLPYDVTVKVKAKDKAGEALSSNDLEIVIAINGIAQPPGDTALVKMAKGETASAQVNFLPLSLLHTAPAVVFDPDKHKDGTLTIETELPVYDTGNLSISGNFVPLAKLEPKPVLDGGEVQTNVRATAAVSKAAFSFTNEKPVDVSKTAQVELRARLVDTQKGRYRPVGEPVMKTIAAKTVEFGSIEVEQITARITFEIKLQDWAAKGLPADAGSVLIGNAQAINTNGVFRGEYEFKTPEDKVTIRGSYTLQSGQKVEGQAVVSGQDIGDFESPVTPFPMDMKLRFYLAGSLRLSGSTKLPPIEESDKPSEVHLNDQKHGVNQSVTPDTAFSLTLQQPILLGEMISIIAEADAAGRQLRGSAEVKVGEKPVGMADVGEILLIQDSSADIAEVKKLMADCKFGEALKVAQQIQQKDPENVWIKQNMAELAKQAEAESKAKPHIEAATQAEKTDIGKAIESLTLAEGENPPQCLLDKIHQWKQELERRKEFADLTQQVARAANVDCDFDRARQLIRQIENIQPRDSWISAWLDSEGAKIKDLARREQEAMSKTAQARNIVKSGALTAEEQKGVVQTLKEAFDIAPPCLRTKLAEDPLFAEVTKKQEPQIKSSIILLIDTSGSMGDSNKIEQAKVAARASVRKANRNTEMAVMAFSGGCGGGSVRTVHEFSSNANSLMDSIDQLSAGGGTPMYIAVGVAVDKVKRQGRGKNRLVVLMSDGGDTCRDQQAAVADSVRTSQIPVNTIGFDIEDNQEAQGDLKQLSSISGGRSYSASAADPREIVRAFDLALLPTLLKDFEGTLANAEQNTAASSYFAHTRQEIQNQNLEDALFYMKQANSIAPDSPAVNYNLSLLFEANDQLINSVDHAKKYLSLSPDALDRTDTETRISNLEDELRRNPRVQHDPTKCRDLYLWAEREKRNAKGNAKRRQMILEILILAQRGNCAEARSLAENYRTFYH